MIGPKRVFKSKEFARFSRKAAIEDAALCRAVEEIHAGLIDADLGGGVFKQRVRRAGQGKSGGFRTILLLRLRDIAIFVLGFSKADRAGISSEELMAFREIARGLLVNEALVSAALQQGKLIEVQCEEAYVVSE